MIRGFPFNPASPYAGVPSTDIVKILDALKTHPEIDDDRVLAVGATNDGNAVVTTGSIKGPLHGAGKTIALSRDDGGHWAVTNIGSWIV